MCGSRAFPEQAGMGSEKNPKDTGFAAGAHSYWGHGYCKPWVQDRNFKAWGQDMATITLKTLET